MNRPRQLSASFVRSVIEPGVYGDGRGGFGLRLVVKRTANGRLSKAWAQRVIVGGRATNLGLGTWPVVTLKEARDTALANRRIIAQGQDPRSGGVPTLEEAAEKVIAIHAAGWRDGGKSEKQWRASLDTYAMAKLGRKPVDQITTSDVLGVLLPIWSTKRETARRVRGRIGAIMKWAVVEGYRSDNPAGDAIGEALPKTAAPRQHQRAIPYSEVVGAIAAVRASGAHWATKAAFEFLVLTASRSGEVRGARWSEIDLDTATWAIPAARMKSNIAHRVPLSNRALQVLAEAQQRKDTSGLVFPSATGKAMSDGTIGKLLRELEINAVAHGFRTSFRTWCSDTGTPRDLAERALAHTVRDQTERAYARSDMLDRRRDLMGQWSEYLNQTGNKLETA